MTRRNPRRRRGRLPFPVFLLTVCAAVTVGATSVRALAAGGAGDAADAAVAGTAERLMAFLDYFAGVFTLLALTAAVVCGLAATDRLVLTPRLRVAAQSVHRATSVAALGFLGTHVAVKVAERDATPLAALLPFGGGATFAVGLGTLAADLLVLAAATGAVRGRFAGSRRPWLWRVLHACAYACWPVALAHGLTAGRAAAVWVLWSYGACAALVALALLARGLGAAERRGGGALRGALRAQAPSPPSRAALAALAALSREHEPVPYAERAEQPAAGSWRAAMAADSVATRSPARAAAPQGAGPLSQVADFAPIPWPEAREHPLLAETPPHGVALPAGLADAAPAPHASPGAWVAQGGILSGADAAWQSPVGTTPHGIAVPAEPATPPGAPGAWAAARAGAWAEGGMMRLVGPTGGGGWPTYEETPAHGVPLPAWPDPVPVFATGGAADPDWVSTEGLRSGQEPAPPAAAWDGAWNAAGVWGHR